MNVTFASDLSAFPGEGGFCRDARRRALLRAVSLCDRHLSTECLLRWRLTLNRVSVCFALLRQPVYVGDPL